MILTQSSTWRRSDGARATLFAGVLLLMTMIATPQSIWSRDLFPNKVVPTYATGFTVQYHENYKVVTVTRPWPGATRHFTYLLVERGTSLPAGVSERYRSASGENPTIVTIPVKSVVTMATTLITPIEELGELDTIHGHDQTRWIYSEAARKRVSEGKIKDVGYGSTLNLELLLKLNPDAIFENAYGGSGTDSSAKLREAHLPAVVVGDWAETSPLGAAEWIKFLSLFYNKEQVANTVFSAVVDRYEKLKKLAATAKSRPTVLVNAPYQGQWTVPAGGSYVAHLLADAGADYPWAHEGKTGSLFLDIESVYAKAGQADFWINTGVWRSLQQARRIDPRFAQFKAFKDGHIYNNNARVSAAGGIDYYESGLSRPDRILGDLVAIFHPELMPDHALYYYHQLH